MGFRTLALERAQRGLAGAGRGQDRVRQVRRVLAKVKEQAEGVVNTLDRAQTRSNMMNRALKQVEALPEPGGGALLPGLPGRRPAPEGG
jgi:DNA recombination protein RmuC